MSAEDVRAEWCEAGELAFALVSDTVVAGGRRETDGELWRRVNASMSECDRRELIMVLAWTTKLLADMSVMALDGDRNMALEKFETGKFELCFARAEHGIERRTA